MTQAQSLWKERLPLGRFSLLLVLLVVSLIVFARVSRATPTNPLFKLKQFVLEQKQQHQQKLDLERDPTPGQPRPEGLTQWLAQQGLAGKPLALLMTGSCSECATSYLKAWSAFAALPGAPAVVVFAASEEAQVEVFQAKHPELNLKLTVAPYPGLEKELNAIFRPRAYYYSADGALGWLQGDHTDPWATLAELKERLGLAGEGKPNAQD